MVDSLRDRVDEDQLKAIRKAVFERESIMSTGVGKGLAIPHGKVELIKHSYASFAILANPVEYESIDGNPVQLVFLLVGPESESSRHIKLLSHISRLMIHASFRETLLSCTEPAEILDAFQREEQTFDS